MENVINFSDSLNELPAQKVLLSDMLSVLNETIHGPLNPTVQKDHLKRLFEAQPEPNVHRKAGNESEPEECPECTPTTKWDFFNSLFFSFTAVTTIGKVLLLFNILDNF